MCLTSILSSSILFTILHCKSSYAFSSRWNHHSTANFVGNTFISSAKKKEGKSISDLPLFSFVKKNDDGDMDNASLDDDDQIPFYPPSMEFAEFQPEPQQQNLNPFAVALDRVERDRERDIEIEQKLHDQQEELERKHSLEIARLKLTLVSTREELNEMEGRAKAFEDNSKGLQKKLFQEIEDKNEKLEKLEQEWTKKSEAQVEAAKNDKMRLAKKLHLELENLELTIEELKSDLSIAEMKSAQLHKRTLQLEKQIADEIENKKNALEELERRLTEEFNAEADELKAFGEQKVEELETFRKQSEEQLLQIQKENKKQRETMESKISSLSNDLERVTLRLKYARRYHGTLRREMNKVKQTAMLELRQQRQAHEKKMKKVKSNYNFQLDALEEESRLEQDRLEKERDDALEQLSFEKNVVKQLNLDSEELKAEFKQKLIETQKMAERDLLNLRVLWTDRLQSTIEKANKEKQDIIQERNEAVAERDLIIDEYEQELSSMRSMLKRTISLLKFRGKIRLKKTRSKLVEMTKKAVLRQDGTLRLTAKQK